jgi:hypothetical protein
MNDVSAMCLLEAWLQGERHMHHLKHHTSALAPFLPVTPMSIGNMDDEVIQDWDQFILRFAKLQHSMGPRLYPALLDYLQKPYQDRPMLDKLHHLEQLDYLSSIDEWDTLRVIRNTFAREYPQDDALKAAYLNKAVDEISLLDALLAKIAPVVESVR